MIYFACTFLQLDHCPFVMGSTSESAVRRLDTVVATPETAAQVPTKPADEVTDECSGASTCEDCTTNPACGWCVGNLFDTNTGIGRGGAKCFMLSPDYSCQGATLTDSCDVYKCPW